MERALDENDTPLGNNPGKNCFNPIGNSDDEVPEKIKPMVKSCAEGCYSLAYEIQVKNRNINSNFDKTVRFHMDRGCVSSLPFALQNIQADGDWRSVDLNEERYGIKGSIKAMISGRGHFLVKLNEKNLK